MATNTPNYEIDYNDKRLTDVTQAENNAYAENDKTYGDLVAGVDEQYKGLQEQIQTNADKLAESQQANTDFAIEQINQQKEQAQKDYTKEQSASYVDYQKQTNQYGANAEQMAMQGLSNSGYSESAKVSMYNTYQNRVATARENLSKIQLNYDNNIQQAILQNNSALAQIYSDATIQQMEIALEGYKYKNSLLLEQANKKFELKQFYAQEYQNVLSQINTENALKEQVRQAEIEQENWQKQYELDLEKERREAEKQQKDLEYAERQMKLAEDEFNARYGANGIETKKANAEVDYYNTQKEAVVKGDLVTNSSYWNGERAQNVGGFGYFSNGYQPKGIMDGGQAYELKSAKTTDGSKATIMKTNTTLWGTEESKEITVWQANGKYYYWNGPDNKYVQISKSELKKMGVNVK